MGYGLAGGSAAIAWIHFAASRGEASQHGLFNTKV